MHRTVPCKVCGKPYTDNIHPGIDPDKGGYVICARCSMRLAAGHRRDEKKLGVEPSKLVEAIKNKNLRHFRQGLNLSQEEFSRKIGFSKRQVIRMEQNLYNPSIKMLRRVERRLKNVTSA